MFGHALHYTAADVDALSLHDFELLCQWLDLYEREIRRKAAQT